jgi:hypothetical protein
MLCTNREATTPAKLPTIPYEIAGCVCRLPENRCLWADKTRRILSPSSRFSIFCKSAYLQAVSQSRMIGPCGSVRLVVLIPTGRSRTPPQASLMEHDINIGRGEIEHEVSYD